MKKGKVVFAIFISCLFAVVLPCQVFADSGPKPSVVLEFEGLEGKEYYITLLSQVSSTGPYSVATGTLADDDWRFEGNPELGKKARQAFINYKDTDGYYFLDYFKLCNEENNFVWGYYPPENFKILIYFPNKEEFIVSEVLERYAFHSYYTVKVDLNHTNHMEIASQSGAITTERGYSYAWEFTSLMVRMLFTVAIELGIAYLFHLRGKSWFGLIIIMNVITQLVLNTLLNLLGLQFGYIGFIITYALLELLVIIIEVIAYLIGNKQYSIQERKPNWLLALYTILANIVSYSGGLIIALHWPIYF